MVASSILSPLAASGTPLPDHAPSPSDSEAAHSHYLSPVIAHCDGCCEPINPGGYACGGVDIVPHPDVPGLERGLQFGRCYIRGAGATNNVAEYNAALDALRAMYRAGWRGPVVLRTDSQLVVRQFNSEYGWHKPELQALLAQLHRAAAHFESLTFEWVPREQNTRADALSRRAYREARRREGRSVP
jgi:ribonuclease HI